MTGNTDMRLLVTDTLKKSRGVDRDTSPSHIVDQAVECCPTPLHWLSEVAGYCRELEHIVVHFDPGHPKHAQWVTCLGLQAVGELGNF